MNCIDLTSERSKLLSRLQNYKSNQITMDCIDFTSKQSKNLSYVVKHSKLRKTTKVIKLQWISSIWCQNIKPTQNYKSDLISMNLHRFDIKTIKTTQIYENHQIIMHASIWRQNDLKSWVTSQNYKSNQITMNSIDLTSERSEMLRYVAKLQKWSYYDEFASIWRENDQNNTKLRSDQIILHCIDLTSKRSKKLRYVVKHSKLRKTTKVIKLQWIAKDLTSKRSKMF